uniref:SH2 domain-containing protein n=1 Tax=Caenorhabditis tropicalis TaxID=1561998 RepID=A0A1I7TX95_9PELO
MSSSSLLSYLFDHVEAWKTQPIALVNARLSALGSRDVTFVHRRGHIKGTVQLLNRNPYDAVFLHEGQWISVKDYFYVRYGRIIDDRCFLLFIKERPDYGLFPLELVDIHD